MSRATMPASGLALFGALVGIAALTCSPAAQARDALLVIAGSARTEFADARPVSGFKKVVKLDDRVIKLATGLVGQIGNRLTYEDGPESPPGLQAFADAVLAAAPDIFTYQSIQVVSDTLVPIELVRKEGRFLGDTAAIGHEFRVTGQRYRRPPPRVKVLSSYVIEAAIPAPVGTLRWEQDFVQVAAELEKDRAFPVHLNLNPAPGSVRRQLVRDDIAILHIDTHGSAKGRSIQATHANDDMMPARDIPRRVRVPLILLVGCEGVADSQAFGAVLRARGAEAIVSSFAKFESFDLTGHREHEKVIYEAFFGALRSGEDVGTALLHLRQAARDKAASNPQRKLARHFFVLVGNQQLRFKLASSQR